MEDTILGEFESLTKGMEISTDRLARQINPCVNYLILPLFALANASMPITINGFGQITRHPVLWSTSAGHLRGKPSALSCFPRLPASSA